jgi:hypothetical protein
MRIHVGCKLRFEFPQTTPMIATLNVHFSRVSALERLDYLVTNPSVPIEGYRRLRHTRPEGGQGFAGRVGGVAVALPKENGEAHVISPEQFACRSCHHNVTACLHTSHCEGCPAERGLSSNF